MAAWPHTHDRWQPMVGSDEQIARRAGWQYAVHRNPHRQGCTPCDNANHLQTLALGPPPAQPRYHVPLENPESPEIPLPKYSVSCRAMA